MMSATGPSSNRRRSRRAAATLTVGALAAGMLAAVSPAAAAARVPGGLAWGANAPYGAFGSGTTTDSGIPAHAIDLPAGTIPTGLVTGTNHSLVVTKGGAVWGFGANANGELGDGSTNDRATPVRSQLPAGVKAAAMSAGANSSMVLTNTGSVYAWGLGDYGQVGNGQALDVFLPSKVNGLLQGKKVTAIAAGDDFDVAATASNGVYAWGYNGDSELGNGDTADSDVPVRVQGLPGRDPVTKLAAGGNHTLALTRSGKLYAWGYNVSGQLGLSGPSNRANATLVTTLPRGVRLVALAAGLSFSAALSTTGKVLTWGDDGSGQLGNGATTGFRSQPEVVAQLPAGDPARHLAVGDSHVVVSTAHGYVFTWGQDTAGQLGDGGPTARSRPYEVAGIARGQVAGVVSAGQAVSLVLTKPRVAPHVTAAPAGVTVAAGAHATFHAAASGSPAPDVSWQVQRRAGGPWAAVAGARSATLITGKVTGVQDGYRYRAGFSNPSGSAISAPATLHVRVALKSSNLPRNLDIRFATRSFPVRVVLSSQVGSATLGLRNDRGILATFALSGHGATGIYTGSALLRRSQFPGTVHDDWMIVTRVPGRTYTIPVTILLG